MNESQILKDHQHSKQTQITNGSQILKYGQISNETQFTNKTKF